MRSLTEKKKGKQDHQSRNHERTRPYASPKKVLRNRNKRKQKEIRKGCILPPRKILTEFGANCMEIRAKENLEAGEREHPFSESRRERVLTLRNRVCGRRAESVKTGRRYHALLVHVQCASHPILGCL
jgi:hypothetical protein